MSTKPSSPDKPNDQKGLKPKPEFPSRDALSGTTRRVFRYIYRKGPVRLHEIQRDLGLSSPSLADYHVQKLLEMKMIRRENEGDLPGFVAEEAVFEAMVRIRRTVIPLRATSSAFFALALVLLLTILRPGYIGSTYVFSLLVVAVALLISIYETVKGLSSQGI